MKYKIPLRNRKKETIDHTFVSKEDYNELNKYKWNKNNNNYVRGKINNKVWSLHRYIMIKLLDNNIDSKIKIDHIDNNPLNNNRNNLRIVTDSENSRNRTKLKNTTSKYIGVCFNKKGNIWQTNIRNDNIRIYAFYLNENHAAHQYNLWCNNFNLTTANLNIIPEHLISDFILYQKQENFNNLPKNISYTKNNKYRVRINSIYYGMYNTLLEAIIIKKIKLKEIENKKNDDILKLPIKRNKDNQAIIEIFNKNKEKICETIVDDDIYYNLMFYSLHKNNKYIQIDKLGLLHRYIMNYNGDNYVDHINNNTLDNRKKNLRIVTAKQNNMNSSSRSNSSSKYIGVSYHNRNKKWQASIKIDNKSLYLGNFKNEEGAAKARDKTTKKYFGEYGNLNFKE